MGRNSLGLDKLLYYLELRGGRGERRKGAGSSVRRVKGMGQV